jgi:uncharacterized protein (DUF885 family)
MCAATLVALATTARADWIADSDRNALEVLSARSEFIPGWGSYYGLARFDGEVSDLRAGVDERYRARMVELLAQMRAREAAATDPRVRQDLAILVQDIEDDIESQAINRAHMLPYYNLHLTIFRGFGTLLAAGTDKDRYPAALERLRKLVGRGEGLRPLTELAIERTRERFDVKGLVGPYVVELQTDLDNAPRLIEGMRGLFAASGLQGWEADLALLEQQLADYADFLRREISPRARADNRLPAAVYADNLKQFGVDATPAELIELAQYSYQLIRNEMRVLARRIAERRGWKERDLVSVLRALKKEQLPPEQVLPRYLQRLAELEEIIRRENLVTLPERDAVIRLATEAEAAAIPASHMRPPQLINNTGQYGEFVLVQTHPALGDDAVMDDWSHDAITWSLTAHEARPGHELQFSMLVENGTSLARAIFANNSANSEGWGLYAESIVEPFVPEEGQLFILYARLFRAARMFIDPLVNTGRMTPDEVVTFYTDQVAISLPMARSEADRYAFQMPGQATAYYYGFMNLMRLRTKIELAIGENFNAREYHDFILAQGLLPPKLLEQAVLERFVPGG